MESVVLLDVPDIGGEFARTILQKLEHPVMVCHGPGRGELCPILATGKCDLVDAAHGIVFALDLDRPQHRAILKKYREVLGPDIPIRAVVRPDQLERFKDVLADVEIWTHEPTVADLDGFAAEVESVDRLGEAVGSVPVAEGGSR
jgi:hypothetical protein